MAPRTSNKVKVYLRTRPTSEFAADMLSIGRDNRSISIHRTPSASVVDNKINDWTFHTDGVLHNASQEEVFNAVARDVIDRTLDGYNGTVLCYGQTGAGKTFTMTGFTESYQNRGIIPRSLQHLFQQINSRQDFSYSVRIAYLEVYNDQMCDLLRTVNSQADYQQQQMSIGEDSGLVYVKGLSYRIANSEEDALNLLFEGETNRAIGQHVLNKQSSRSHCIFTILIECRSILSSEEKYTISKLNLVDLAGSERLAKTNSEGVTKREATFINKSLSFLEQAVINLSDKKVNTVHFRSSKLTHALKDSIGGRCNTVMIANIWPEMQHLEETVSTLRFASRMMCVPAEPTVNEIIDPVQALENYKRENKQLREELALHDKLLNRTGASYEPLTDQQLKEVDEQCRRFIDGSLDEIEVQNLRQVQAIFNSFRNLCLEGKTKRKTSDQQENQKMPNVEIDRRAAPRQDAALSNPILTTKPKISGPKGSGDFQRGVSLEEDFNGRVKENSDVSDSKDIRLSIPAEKSAAFEEFRRTRGANLNRIYLENKETVGAKKKQFAELARRVNQTKSDIDRTRMEAERKKNERLTMGEFLNENGETIIDEEEFRFISKLQELKGIYRSNYDQWKNLKSELSYSQNLLNQYQNRLLQEFDVWFNEQNPSANPMVRNGSFGSTRSRDDYRFLDEAEDRFDHFQRDLLTSDLDNTPYRQAQIRSGQRQIHETGIGQTNWRQGPSTTTIRMNSDPYSPVSSGQTQQNLSSIPVNGSRQKPMVR